MSDSKKISAAPSWLGLSDDRERYLFVPERAAVVRRIFELAIGGMGSYAIAHYLDEKKIPTFTQSGAWDHTTIDYMLRNRATYGEYQPKSFAGGHKKGIPNGSPILNHYPAVIDQTTYEVAQVARRQNLANRGRKGNELANIFAGLTKCAYCGNEIALHRVTNIQVLACEQDLNGVGCSRTAWTYRDFEITGLAFLAHPALTESLWGRQKEKLIDLVDKIVGVSTSHKRSFALRVDIAVLLKEIVTNIVVHSAGDVSIPRLPSAQMSKDVKGRYAEICLFGGELSKCLSLT